MVLQSRDSWGAQQAQQIAFAVVRLRNVMTANGHLATDVGDANIKQGFFFPESLLGVRQATTLPTVGTGFDSTSFEPNLSKLIRRIVVQPVGFGPFRHRLKWLGATVGQAIPSCNG